MGWSAVFGQHCLIEESHTFAPRVVFKEGILFGATGLERLELTSDGVMTRDLSPLSLLQNLQFLQITSFNDPVRYPIHPAICMVTSLRELSLRALSLDLIQVRGSPMLSADPFPCLVGG